MNNRVTTRASVIGVENSRSFQTPRIALLGKELLKSYRFIFVRSDNPPCYFKDDQTILINLPTRRNSLKALSPGYPEKTPRLRRRKTEVSPNV